MTTLVFNGWAAGAEAWELTSFARDWTFSYIEELDGVPEKVLRDIEGSFLFVGFSMGGAAALELFLNHPDRVAGLVLVSATPRMMEDKATGWRGLSARRLEALRLGTELLFADDPSPVYEGKSLRRGLDFLRTTDLRARLVDFARRVDAPKRPVEIVQSRRDGIVRPENVEFLKTVFPQARVTWVEGNEHVLPVTAPKTIDRVVARCRREATKKSKASVLLCSSVLKY